MSIRHVRLASQASAKLQSTTTCSELEMPVMPEYMPKEAYYQADRGINMVKRNMYEKGYIKRYNYINKYWLQGK